MVREHFEIDTKVYLTEDIVRQAALRIVPLGTEVNEAAKILSAHGLAHPNWPDNAAGNRACFPDRTPIVCQFRSPREKRYSNEPNWSIEFFFDEKKRLEEIEVRRWFFRQQSGGSSSNRQ
jgi:hypothetical protein